MMLKTSSQTQESQGLMRDGIYGQIRDEILSCKLSPGAQLREQELAQRYGVSKSPIRDALLRLQEQNLVEVLPRKGYRVRPISVSDAIEMYEMRLLHERACVMSVIDHTPDAELLQLEAFRASPLGVDMSVWINYNRHFHIAVAKLCHNKRLARAATDIIEQFDRLTYVSVTGPAPNAGLQSFVAEHAALIDALKARDKRLASSIIRKHIESSRKRMMEAIANPAIVP